MSSGDLPELERERKRQADFIERNGSFYQELVRILGACVERGDNQDLWLHAAYISRILEGAFNLRMAIERADQAAAGNA